MAESIASCLFIDFYRIRKGKIAILCRLENIMDAKHRIGGWFERNYSAQQVEFLVKYACRRDTAHFDIDC